MRAEPQRVEERHAAAADLLVDDVVEPDIEHGAEVSGRREAR